MGEILYYIQNRDAGFLGNSPIWWGLNRQGYTGNLDAAHKFTEAEAKDICLNNPDKNKAWRCGYIDNLMPGIQRIVDSQYMETENIKKFDK